MQAAITAAGKQLPQTLSTPPTYRKVNPADSPILILSARSDSLPLTTVDDYADNVLAQQISQVSGVGQVAIAGEQKPAIRVQVDPGKLAASGLTLEDVRGSLVIATTNAAKGTLNGAQHELHDRHQRSAHAAASNTTTSSSPTATAHRCACATSATPSRPRPTTRWRPTRTTGAASCCWSSSSRAPT